MRTSCAHGAGLVGRVHRSQSGSVVKDRWIIRRWRCIYTPRSIPRHYVWTHITWETTGLLFFRMKLHKERRTRKKLVRVKKISTSLGTCDAGLIIIARMNWRKFQLIKIDCRTRERRPDITCVAGTVVYSTVPCYVSQLLVSEITARWAFLYAVLFRSRFCTAKCSRPIRKRYKERCCNNCN